MYAAQRLRTGNWRGSLLAFSLLFMAASAPLLARDDYVPPRVAYLDGSGAYESAGDVDWSELTVNLPLLSGDRVVSHPGSRVEIELGYDNFLRLGGDTDLTFQRANGSETELELSLGEVILRVNESSRFRVFTPDATVNIKKEGLYRISVGEDGVATVTVRKGEARVANGFRERKVKVGERLIIEGPQSSLSQVAYSWGDDGFDTWSDRRDAQYVSSRSSQYVSARYAGVYDLDRYGSWEYVPAYGSSIWFPYGVVSGWSPYSSGYWRHYPSYGWTWVGFEPWAWLPYHYGSWYLYAGRWGWCPGRFSIWSPALVDFYYGGGYIGWAPRGYYGNRPGRHFTVINNNTTTIVNNNGWHAGGSRRGLTVIPENDFGRGRIDQVAVREPSERLIGGLRPTARVDLPARPNRSLTGVGAAAPVRGVSGARTTRIGNSSPTSAATSNSLQGTPGSAWSGRGGRGASQPEVITVPGQSNNADRGRGRTSSSASPVVRTPSRGSSSPAASSTSPGRSWSSPGRDAVRGSAPTRTPNPRVTTPSRSTPSRTVAPPPRRTPTVNRGPRTRSSRPRVAPSRTPSRTVSPSRTRSTSRPAVRPSSPPRVSRTPTARPSSRPRSSRPPATRERKP